MSESHSETRVLEYRFSTPFRHTKGYLRVLDGGRALARAVPLQLLGALAAHGPGDLLRLGLVHVLGCRLQVPAETRSFD